MTEESFKRFFLYCRKLGSKISSLIGGIIIILFSGQHLAYGIFDHRVINHKWYRDLLPQATQWHFKVVVVWFLAIIPGLLVGIRLLKTFSKFSIYLISLSLALASSILFIFLSDNIQCILMARLLAGLSFGVGYIVILIHVAEIAENELHGTLVSLIHMITFFGVFLSSTLNTSSINIHMCENVDFNRIFGFISTCYIIVGMILMYFLHKESPVILSQCQREQENDETNKQSNFLSIFYIIVLRIAHVCTFNMPLNIILLLTTNRIISIVDADLTEMLLSFVRYFMSLFIMGLIDLWRRQFALISTAMSAFLMLSISLLTYLYGIDYTHPSYIVAAGFLLQIFASMGVKIHADILSVECLNNNQKPFAIAQSFFMENVVHILFVVTYFHDNMRIIKFALGSMTVILALTFGMIILGYPSSNRRKLNNTKEIREKMIIQNYEI
ncbi:hypothetical protein PVAND_004486 [Polypedilum vanderplanki]|uniref:Major facilitator superfamily (MFS) profile domain-containing protein n=1 Tax=Polypedilum vanderplanki TaxID=319348 RepID=A0A9J6BXA8_POLVA|nr:hypothetical protein PVAND_004486 [Polypedilum vanderplanki]